LKLAVTVHGIILDTAVTTQFAGVPRLTSKRKQWDANNEWDLSYTSCI